MLAVGWFGLVWLKFGWHRQCPRFSPCGPERSETAHGRARTPNGVRALRQRRGQHPHRVRVLFGLCTGQTVAGAATPTTTRSLSHNRRPARTGTGTAAVRKTGGGECVVASCRRWKRLRRSESGGVRTRSCVVRCQRWDRSGSLRSSRVANMG